MNSQAPPSTNPIPGGSQPFQRLDRCAGWPYPLGWYVKRLLWEWVQATLIRLSPRRAHNWRRFWLRRFGAKMAPFSSTKPSTRIKHPWLLTMGTYSCLSEEVEVYNLGPITVGDHTIVSQQAYLCAGSHDYSRPDLPLLRPSIVIGGGVWVCMGAYIGPGVNIGDNAVIGARAVVVKDVPAGMVVAGNPARVIKPRPMKPLDPNP